MILSTAEILDTYIFKVGLRQSRYGLGAAAGLFKSTVGIVLLLAANTASKHLTENKQTFL
jgi:putative aldouronate transport system permease protein